MNPLALLAEMASEAHAEPESVEGWLRYLAELGAWDLVSIVMAVTGVIGVSLWLFVPRRRVPGLNVYVTSERVPADRAGDERFPLRLRMEIRNFSGAPVLIRRAGFTFVALRADPQCPMHTETKECEVKFPGRVPNELCEPDCYLRQGGCVLTWIAIDSGHTDQEINEALQANRVGVLRCSIVHLREKAQLYELKTRC